MKSTNRLTEILSMRHLLQLALGSFVILYFFNSIYSRFDHDEFEAIHSAWKILNGEVIYVDFFQHHHPFLYYLFVPILKLSGEGIRSILFIRIFVFFVFILILITTYNITVKLFDNKNTGLISVTLLCSTLLFFDKAIQIRPDVPQVLFGLLAIYFFIDHRRSDSTRNLCLSALSLGISFLFLQKAIFLMAGIFLLQLVRLCKGKFTFRQIFVYWCFVAFSLSPYFFYLLINGFIADYFLWNWLINLNFTNAFSPLDYLQKSFTENYLVWVFFFVGLIQSREQNSRDLCILSLVLLLSVFAVQTPYKQYYMMFLPLMAIIAGNGIVSTFKSNKVLVIVVIVVLAQPMFKYSEQISSKNHKRQLAQLEKIQYVLSNTSEDDRVYDGDIKFNVFRKDVDFFWFSVRPKTGALATYQSLNPYEYNIYELIAKFEPAIISKRYIDNVANEIIANHYYRSDKYDDILIRK